MTIRLVNGTDLATQAELDAVNNALDVRLDVLEARYLFAPAPTGVAATDTANLQAVFNVALNKCVVFQAGTYILNAGLTLPNGSVDLAGQGRFASILKWTTDLGDGNYGLVNQSLTNLNIRHLGFQAPDVAAVIGTVANHMRAFKTTGKGVYSNLFIKNFKYGCCIASDHETLEDFFHDGNYIGIYWSESPPTKGNQTLRHITCSWARLAAFGVAASNTIEACDITECHLGPAPFGIYGETGRVTSGAFCSSNTFTNCYWEFIGNGCVYSDGFNGFFGYNVFVNSSTITAVNPTYTASGFPKDYSCYVEYVQENKLIASNAPYGIQGDLGWVYCRYFLEENWESGMEATIDAAQATDTAGTGDTTNGSPTILNATATTGTFIKGQQIEVTDSRFPLGTVITAVSGSTLTVSNNATVTSATAPLNAGKRVVTLSFPNGGSYVRRCIGRYYGNKFRMFRLETSTTTHKRYDVLGWSDEQSGTFGERCRKDNTRPAAGVALHGGGAFDQVVPVQVEGSVYVNTTDSIPTVRTWLKPHATGGSVAAQVTANDGLALGFTLAASDGTKVLANFQPSSRAPVTFVSKTTTYTALSGDRLILCDATSGGFTVTLPSAGSSTGAEIVIKKTDSSANIVTISRAGSDTIEGATSLTLLAQYDYARLVTTGTAVWYAA